MKHPIKPQFNLLFISLCIIVLTACNPLQAGEVELPSAADSASVNGDDLVLAFIPQENPEKLLGDVNEITVYLAEELAMPVKTPVSARICRSSRTSIPMALLQFLTGFYHTFI